MLVPPFVQFLHPREVRRDQITSVIKGQRRFTGGVLLVLTGLLIFIQLYVWPWYKNFLFYSQESILVQDIDSMVTLAWLVVVLGIVVGGYFLISEPNYQQLSTVISLYKRGELVPTNKITDKTLNTILFIAVMWMTVYLTMIFILPLFRI